MLEFAAWEGFSGLLHLLFSLPRQVDEEKAALEKHFGIIGISERICKNFFCPQAEGGSERIKES